MSTTTLHPAHGTDSDRVVATFTSMAEADEAVRRLGEHDFPVDTVTVMTEGLERSRSVAGFVTTGYVTRMGAVTGAWWGGFIGLLFGIGFIFVPFGSVVGGALAWLSAAALGALVGALVGAGAGVVGGSVLSRRRIPRYREHVEAGRYALHVTGSPELHRRAEELLGTGSADAFEQVGER